MIHPCIVGIHIKENIAKFRLPASNKHSRRSVIAKAKLRLILFGRDFLFFGLFVICAGVDEFNYTP